MDDIFKPLRHLAHQPRRFPSPLVVDSIGYIPKKTNWVRFVFHSYNFSFILSGHGEYWIGDTCWQIRAPCVITQAPGVRQEYGPSSACGSWEELYVIYNEARIPQLRRTGLLRPATPVWNIQNPLPTRNRLLELQQAAAAKDPQGMADRVDRICELMILESILGETRGELTPEACAIEAIRAQVALQFRDAHDFHALARKHGLSDSTFRRYWAKQIGPPPAHYLMQLRIAEACRLLVETRLSLGEIARASGFSDPLYFYRRFHLATGLTAVTYRRKHQSPLSLLV